MRKQTEQEKERANKQLDFEERMIPLERFLCDERKNHKSTEMKKYYSNLLNELHASTPESAFSEELKFEYSKLW